MKTKTIPIPIYFGKFTIILTDNYSEVDNKYKTKAAGKNYLGFAFKAFDKEEYVMVLRKVDWSVIAHEAVHIVNMIYTSTEIELDRYNDEPQAYLTGWVVNEVDKFLKINN